MGNHLIHFLARVLRFGIGGLLVALPLDPGRVFAETSARGDSGRIKFESHSHDFGNVFRGEVLKHRFSFVNVGTGNVTIQGVHAACGCTAAEVDKAKVYAPGETGFVDVSLDTANFRGKLVKAVTVITSERQLADRTLTLKANVAEHLRADPPIVDFGEVQLSESPAKTVNIVSVNGFKAEIKNLEYNRKLLNVGFSRDSKDSNRWNINIALQPNVPIGFLKETVQVRNNSSAMPNLPILVRANVIGPISMTPNYIEFGAIPTGDKSSRSVSLQGTQDFDISGLRIEFHVNGNRIGDASNLVRVDTLPDGNMRKRVAIELRHPGALSGSAHGKLFLKTTDPRQEEMVVDFYAFLR